MQPIIKQRTVDQSCLNQLASADLDPILKRVFAARGVTSITDLQLGLGQLLPASTLLGLDTAVNLLSDAIKEQALILIVGDFDADGATSTALMLLALTQMGAKVDYLIPDRFKFGYGLTPEIVNHALSICQPQLIVTVDNGISSHEGVKVAQQAGVKVVITDHHLTTKPTPPAEAVVNPNQLGCTFSSKTLAGVGVAFYVLATLATHQKKLGLATANMTDYLDLVALGTVADVAQLDHNNRILVHQGLLRIKASRGRVGLQALLDIAGRKAAQLTAQDLGFVLGPRINAAGRMDNMRVGVECLIAKTYEDALVLAKELDHFNTQRRSVEAQMKEEALELLTQLPLIESSTEATPLPANAPAEQAIVLYEPTWHQGVIGIVAGRLKEQFNRPAIVFAPSDDSLQVLKGSARSVDGVHIRDVIEQVAEMHPGLVTHFGGHAMAAGLSLPAEHYEAFKTAFLHQMSSFDPAIFNAIIQTDGDLDEHCFTPAFTQQLAQAAPWGTGFPSPVFEGTFKLVKHQLLKDKHLKLTVALPSSGLWLDGIMFNIDTDHWQHSVASIPQSKLIHLAYTLELNTFNGQTKQQLMIKFWNFMQ